MLDSFVANGGATCRFLVGPYGSGKTHLLSLLRDAALRREMAVVTTELSAALSFEDSYDVTAHVLENITVDVEGTLVKSLPCVLNALANREEVAVDRLLEAKLPHPGFREAIAVALRTPCQGFHPRSELSRFLLGERIGSMLLRAVGIRGVRDPLSTRNAEQILTTVLGGLPRVGVRGTLLLFDENERMFSGTSAHSRRVQSGANMIRRMIDASASGAMVHTAAVFAVLPGFLQTCSRVYPALGQRLQMGFNTDGDVAWRWPVLPVDGTSESFDEPERFFCEITAKLIRLLKSCGCDPSGLKESMNSRGREVLIRHAGADFKRPLMKCLATIALERIRG